MIFTDFWFFPFFLVVLAVSNLLLKDKKKTKILFLTLASYFFYATWSWKLASLILISTLIDFHVGKVIHRTRNKTKAKIYLALSLSANLAILGFFKYYNFFLDNINVIFNSNFAAWNIILPVGISFYTFQSMSYSIDIYRKHMKPEKSFLNFAFFVSFFPQLVAGPIVRAIEFLPQTKHNVKVKFNDLSEGLQIFIQGLVKKLLIANSFSIYADAVFASPELYSSTTIWLGVIAYAFQIYCDFSGYSDMAIGIAKMLGFNLVKNFDMPYLAHNITEFWRKWHISLSRWNRDYIYISLGGNRLGILRQYFNLMVTMLLGGLWHGASWNFVVWGGLHGTALVFDKMFNINRKDRSKIFKLISWFLTMIFILITWVFFRADSFSKAFFMLHKMFIEFNLGVNWYYSPFFLWLPFIIIAHLVGTHMRKKNKEYLLVNLKTFVGLLILFLVILTIVIFNPSVVQPFIYFQF